MLIREIKGMSKLRNEDVPDETIIRQLTNENRKLRMQVGELKTAVNNKDNAIKSFKKWQANVADYKWQYWLSNGIKLMNEAPDESLVKQLRELLTANDIFENWRRRLDAAYKSYATAKERMRVKLEQ